MTSPNNNAFLNTVFEHILGIAKGQCSINDDYIFSYNDANERRILEGLLYLHQDLELYKIELRRAIEAEYKVKALEGKNKQLKQFNSAASHDLREPLRSIFSFSSLVLKDNQDILNEKDKTYLKYVIDASHRMSNLITGLMKYTTIDQFKNTSEIDTKFLVENICLDLNELIKSKQASLHIGELPTINCYGLQIRQLFQNLIANALKFSQKEVNPIIKIDYIKIPNKHQFSIEDNGIGIKTKFFEAVFEIFRRLHPGHEYEGSGIGLALCQKIVEMHEGEIWVESEYNQGSKFYFTLSDTL